MKEIITGYKVCITCHDLVPAKFCIGKLGYVIGECEICQSHRKGKDDGE